MHFRKTPSLGKPLIFLKALSTLHNGHFYPVCHYQLGLSEISNQLLNVDGRKYYQTSDLSLAIIMEKFPSLGIIIIACIAKLIWVWSHQMTYRDAPKSLLPELEVANDTFCDELFGSCTVMGEFFKVRRIILKG